jgi:hypothetical protein
MKLLTKLSASLFWIGLSSLLVMCKKENTDNSMAAAINHPPIANAGADITLERVSCSSPNAAGLNGGSSSDPDHDKLLYTWTKLSGPPCSLFSAYSPDAQVNDLQPGQYAFELNVTDPSGLSSKDTAVIYVRGIPAPIEVDLDVSLDGNYTFGTNDGLDYVYLILCQVYGSCPPRDFKARTNFFTSFHLPTLGLFHLRIDETADTSAASSNHQTYIAITSANNNIPSGSVSGQFSVNFKQLIQGGGGPFNGTLQVNSGSALGCDPNILVNLAPLTDSGTLDAGAHIISLTLKGKVYF